MIFFSRPSLLAVNLSGPTEYLDGVGIADVMILSMRVISSALRLAGRVFQRRRRKIMKVLAWIREALWIIVVSVLYALIIAACVSQAQGQAFVTGAVTIYDQLGYKNPAVSGGIGYQHEGLHYYALAQGAIGAARKVETGDGWRGEAEGSGYLRLRAFLLGAGARWSRESTSQWSKSAVRPFVGAGITASAAHLRLDYLLPSFDAQNGLEGPRGTLEIKGGRKWSLVISEGFYSFHDTRVKGVDYGVPATRHWGAESGIGLRYYFKGVK